MQYKITTLITIVALASSSILHAQMRAFTNDNGTVIQAELVSHQGEKVKLRRADGREFEVIPSIFSDEDEAHIKNWMARTPATRNYNLRIATAKKKIEGTTQNHGYKRVKNDLWSYLISLTNNSQDSVSKLTVKYRVFYSNVADGEYSASSSDGPPLRMIEGEAKLDAELAFNRTLEVTTTPIQIDSVNYSYGNRYKDSLRGCLVRVLDEADNVVMDWVSPETTMKGKDWFNTNPKSGGKPAGKPAPVIR